MAQRDDWLIHLGPAQVVELEAAARPLVAQGDVVASELPHLSASSFALPTLGPQLEAVREELLHGRGFAVLRGVPIERYQMLELATIFMGLSGHLGRPRSQNASGHVLGHVYDAGLRSTDLNVRLYQTSQRQTFHTDSCDVVGLLCLREARSGGDSLVVSGLAIFNELRQARPDLLLRLLEPMPHDRRGEVPAGMKPFFNIPVFSWYAGQLTLFYQRQYVDSAQRFDEARRLTNEDIAALDLFDAVCNDERLPLRMRLRPGDIQFVHNHTTLHDRLGFEDWPGQERKRHLLRLWLACPGGRALPPEFAARYGAVESGDRGGIIVPGTQIQVPLRPTEGRS